MGSKFVSVPEGGSLKVTGVTLGAKAMLWGEVGSMAGQVRWAPINESSRQYALTRGDREQTLERTIDMITL